MIMTFTLILSGDLLGATLAGLGDLLQTSSGSGEQNMISFTPNVYVSAYLKATGRLTEEIKKKTAKFLEGGSITFLIIGHCVYFYKKNF